LHAEKQAENSGTPKNQGKEWHGHEYFQQGKKEVVCLFGFWK